jgi:hypothetical protein
VLFVGFVLFVNDQLPQSIPGVIIGINLFMISLLIFDVNRERKQAAHAISSDNQYPYRCSGVRAVSVSRSKSSGLYFVSVGMVLILLAEKQPRGSLG